MQKYNSGRGGLRNGVGRPSLPPDKKRKKYQYYLNTEEKKIMDECLAEQRKDARKESIL